LSVTRLQYPAGFFDGVSAQRQQVEVTIAAAGLLITKPDASTVWWPSEEIEVTDRGQPVRLCRKGRPPQELIINEAGFLEAARLGRESGESSLAAKIVALLAILVALVWSLYQFVLPAIGERIAASVPVELEERFGRAVADRFAPPDSRIEDPRAQEAVEEIGRLLRAELGRTRYQFRFYIADDPMVNAFAAPGGHVVIFRGLIKMTRSPHELAAVMAHEMQHVRMRHVTRALLRTLGIRALMSFIAGDTSGLVFDVAALAGDMHFRRNDEEHADREAMRLIQRAGFDDRAMVKIYRRMARETADAPGPLQYLSTHPEMESRVETIEKMARGGAPRALLPGRKWPPL